MRETTTTTPSAPAAATRVAERWADFVKTVAIYPETNVRVTRAFEAFEAARAAAFEARQPGDEAAVEIVFYRDALHTEDGVVPIESGTNLGWIHDRLDRAGLAGVRFARDIPRDALQAFSERLLSHYNRRILDLPFEALWPDDYEGITLVDRRLEGRASGDDSGERARTWRTGDGDGRGTPGPGDEGETGDDLAQARQVEAAPVEGEEAVVRALLDHGEIAERLLGLGDDAAAARAAAPEGSRRLEVLQRIVRLMPADVRSDPRRVVDLTARTLDLVRARLAGSGGEDVETAAADGEASSDALPRLLFLLSRNVFGREGPDATRLSREIRVAGRRDETTGAQGHAGDELIEADHEAFESEREALPTGPIDLAADAFEDEAEVAGVYLHFLVHFEADEDGRRMHEPLRRICTAPKHETLGVLEEYLRAHYHRADNLTEGLRFDRLVSFLREASLMHIVRDCGLVSLETQLESFPHDFSLYLDTLDADASDDHRELDHLLEQLGPERLLAAAPALVTPGALLDPVRLDHLLAFRSSRALPLAHALLRDGPREVVAPIVAYLQRIDLPGDRARILRLFPQGEWLSTSFLLALTAAAPDGPAGADLAREAVELLERYLLRTRGEPAEEPRRVEAVRLLASFPGERSATLLRSLLRARRWGLLPREPAAVRAAARDGLRAVRLMRR